MTNKEHIRRIEYARLQLEQQKKKIEDLEYIKECLEDNYLSNIRIFTSKYDILGLHECWTFYINSKKEEYKQDKETYKKGKSLYDFFIKSVFEDFFLTDNKDKRFKVKDFRVYFDGGNIYELGIFDNTTNKIYQLDIPIRQQLTKENYNSLRSGKFVFLEQTSEHSYTYLFDSYDEEEFGKKIRNFIDGDKNE